jgi:cobalt/nickel transport system ATP-binding protein
MSSCPPSTAPELLTCVDVRCVYPDDSVALDGVCFSLRRGERVGLIGPNGAGKSTLLRALIGVQDFGGSITIDGIHLRPSTAREVRQRIGLVFQNPDDQLFSPSIAEDVAFGPRSMGLPREEAAKRTIEALVSVDLRDMADRNPMHLSFGERRRAAIASVLSMRPLLLAMDEPSSNLDPVHRRRLMEWLNAQPDLTLLLATHDLDMVAETCDRVLLLSRSIAADGHAREILTDTALLATHGLEAPLGLQSLIFRRTRDNTE